MCITSYETLSLVLACVFSSSTSLLDLVCDFCESPEFVFLIFLPRNFEIIVSFYL
jgi:hypothetical protein